MGEQNRRQGPGREHLSAREQGAAWSRSAYGIPFDAGWSSLRSVGAFPSALAHRSPAPADQHAHATDPTHMEFWTRHGGGYRLLAGAAAVHLGVGLLGALASVLVWSISRPAPLVLPLALGPALGATVALAGGGVLGLTRAGEPRAALGARVLLPVVDLAAAACLFWALGESVPTLLLFLLSALMAAVLLSWRSGAVCAAAGVACFAGLSALRWEMPLAQVALESLALAAAAGVLVLGIGVYTAILAGAQASLRAELALVRGQRETQAAEQQRLLETLNVLEDAQVRLERERMQVNQQIAEVAATAHRLADGDLGAIRTLQPGLFGPLEGLRGALGRLSLRLARSAGAQTSAREQVRSLEAVMAASREQAQLLVATDSALRALGAAANELVAEVQVVQRGSGELPGVDRRQLFQMMRGMEQRAMTQASNTAMLGARLAQLRTRQSEIDAELRQVNRLSQPLGGSLTWESSGLRQATMGRDEAPYGGADR